MVVSARLSVAVPRGVMQPESHRAPVPTSGVLYGLMALVFAVVATAIAMIRFRPSPLYPAFNDVNSDVYVYQLIGNSWVDGLLPTNLDFKDELFALHQFAAEQITSNTVAISFVSIFCWFLLRARRSGSSDSIALTIAFGCRCWGL